MRDRNERKKRGRRDPLVGLLPMGVLGGEDLGRLQIGVARLRKRVVMVVVVRLCTERMDVGALVAVVVVDDVDGARRHSRREEGCHDCGGEEAEPPARHRDTRGYTRAGRAGRREATAAADT
jgi:hypothetical protein